ncbi:MAG: DUF86 domain-containing protein [Candidatus Yanofskybacteria bacterium]|nr:DUF86 domain-containing protein [Candidatus Yanofskybacteria bacterium]
MKEISVYLKNIIDKAREAIDFCVGMSEEEFLKDGKTQSAVILKLIVIGEEAKKVPEEVTSKIDLPWRMIKGFRNMAIHEYFNIDLVIIWHSVQNDLPTLIVKITKYLENRAV